MAELINLRQARKRKRRQDAEGRAAQNRALYGRTKEEKQRAKLEAERANRRLEQHRREDDGGDASAT